ncbi:MAG: transporter substrate-binding domain-containing protein [Ruminococcaceae bacterium]|nr:transporter substrate-binding domain-containing protein [Oscillospiraceae bacterium]
MKKFFALVLAILMVASLAACNGTSNTDGKTYVIYSDNAFAPFEYLDEASGEYVGLDMDIFAAIAEDQGFAYEMHNEGFDASMGAVQSGQADGMIAGMTITDERRESYDFAEGYFEDGQVLVVKNGSDIKDFDDLDGKTIACKTSTVGGEYAESIKDEYGFTINYYEGSNEMYQAVVTGADAACIEDFSVIGWAINSEDLPLTIVTEDPFNNSFYGFAVKKGTNPELIEMFNAGLANIKENGTYDELLAKYGY